MCRSGFGRVVGAWLLAACLFGPAVAKTPDKNDVRLLIDISGSMLKNDPQNLRRPALRMLVGLMQPGTRAGVWTFAEWTNPLVPLAEVDSAWKERAMRSSGQINSPGMFTHIERALEEAARDWQGEPSSHNRHLVLLTDGMVDVSKVPAESAASRQRIVEQWLPRLQQLGVKVHTIALSERADHALMKQLSGGTDGWYEQVESADQLQRVFLKMFEQVGRPDTVPLDGNKFTVDSSVQEATLLLFRAPGSVAPVLISPTGEQYSDSDIIGGVAWYRDEGYDLVTIANPAKGEWILQAELDPDNRVMIVTELKLETSEIPAHIIAGEQITASAHLNNRGQVVKRKAFLRLLDIRADAMTASGSEPLGLNDAGQDADEKAEDGHYSLRYSANHAIPEVEMLFSVESPTFMREKRYRLAVHEPLVFTVEPSPGPETVRVDLHPSMRPGASIEVWQDDPSGAIADLIKDDSGAYRLQDPQAPVYAKVRGISKLGHAVEREVGPFYPLGAPEQAVQPQPAPEPAPEPVPAPEPAPAPAAPEPPPQPQEEAVEEEEDSLLPMLLFGMFNLLLIGGGLTTWLLMRKRGGAEDLDLLDDYEKALQEREANQAEDTTPGSDESAQIEIDAETPAGAEDDAPSEGAKKGDKA